MGDFQHARAVWVKTDTTSPRHHLAEVA